MFTGLVEASGRVLSFERGDEGARLIVDVPFASELEPGESVAVDGCCLTQLPDRDGDLRRPAICIVLKHEFRQHAFTQAAIGNANPRRRPDGADLLQNGATRKHEIGPFAANTG